MAKPPSKTPRADQGRAPTEDELRVWEAVTRQDARLAHAEIAWDTVLEEFEDEHPTAYDAGFTHRPTPDQLQQLLSYTRGVPLEDKKPVPFHTIDANTTRRLRRGQLPVEAVLDLHGMTQEAAEIALAGFIRRAHGSRKRVVQVITGKGRFSAVEGGVLRRALPRWLQTEALAPLVLTYTASRQQDGGEGAFYILLRRQRT